MLFLVMFVYYSNIKICKCANIYFYNYCLTNNFDFVHVHKIMFNNKY